MGSLHSRWLEKMKTELYAPLVARKPHLIRAVSSVGILNLSESVIHLKK